MAAVCANQLASADVDRLAGQLEQMLSQIPNIVDYSLDDDEEAEDSVPQEPIAAEPLPPKMESRNRRQSVCAEPVVPEDLNKMVSKVYPKTPEEKVRLKEYIAHNILFAGLDEKQKIIIMDAMFEVKKNPGEVIIRQGDEGDNFYVVDSGDCDVFVSKPGQEPKKVLSCPSGESFGELALMYNAPRAATVIARSPTRLWAVDRITFKLILMDTTIKQRNLYESFLEKVPILANLSKCERLTIADALRHVKFAGGVEIIREGEPGDTFYIIEEGEVVCTQTPSAGQKPEEVGRLKTGDYFGEVALLTDKPRAATVTAIRDTECLTLSRVTFTRVMGPLTTILKRNIAAYRSYVALM